MKDKPTLNRRRFLRTTGHAATALAAVSTFTPAVLSAPSPGKTIGVGCIGLGTRGGDLINAVVNAPNAKVTAVCDVYGPHRQKGIERSLNPAVKTYVDYRGLLADRNVDAVLIGTPDHWHCQMVLDAVKAGKVIYCEKGFARTLAEAKLMRDALKRSNVVFQLGHHARQAACALQAKELIAKGYEWKKTPKQPNHMVDWVNCIQNRGTPKCSTDEAFIETATFLMSLASYQQRRQVRWDAAREEIV